MSADWAAKLRAARLRPIEAPPVFLGHCPACDGYRVVRATPAAPPEKCTACQGTGWHINSLP